MHSQRVFRLSCVFFLLCAVGSLVLFWPILIKEDFEAYLQCDGPQHGRLHMLRELRKVQAHERRLQPVKERTQPHFFIRLIYATRDGSNIFTPEYLKRIKHIEDRLETLPGYRRFCLADGNGRCVRPLSAVNYFFASMDASTGTITPNGRGEHLLPIQAILANLGTSNSYFVDRYFGVSSGQLKSALEGNITRSVLRFGLPLRGFQNTEDHRQAEMFGEFVRDQLRPYLIEASSEKLRVYFYGDQVTQLEVESAVWHDATYAIGSLLFIFVYLVFYLRSVVLTVMALFCIALSFPISYACYCFVYGHGKMIAINFLSFFVVLGVGADDVFVLHDVWVLSRRHGTGEMALARRLWSMYCKAGMAIFATSATTAASFFANLASSIGPLRQFGFFMGTCITVNWILVAVMYPLILVNYERSTCKGALIEAEQSSPMEEQLVDSCQGTDLDVEDGSGCSPGDVVRRASSKGTLGGGLAVKMLAFCVSFLGIGGSVYALHSAVRNLRPSNGLPKFFPEDSNLGGLQELQMRFGNETSIESTELKLCHGRAQDAKLVCDGKSGPTATVAPPTEPPPLHLPQDKDMEVPPLPHPPLTPKPSEKHPQPQPRPQPTLRPVAPSQRPSPSPAAAAPVAAKGFDLQLEVKGHSIADIQEFEDLVRDQIVESLRLSPEDLSFDIKKLKVLDGRRLQEGQYEVTLHFQHVTPEKEREIREYLRQHKDLLSLLGAEAPTPAQKPHPPQPQAPLHPPHASHASPQSPQPPITKLSSTRQPAATTSEPTRGPATSHPEAPHTRRTTVPPTQSKLTTLPSTVPATSTSAKLAPATTAVSSKLRPSTTSMTSSTAMQLHLQPRGMPHDRQAVIHVLLGVREVRGLGSAYTYELDESFDLSRREAQLAIVEFCQRLRQEARLKVVKGQWSCWPSKLKDFLLRRGEQFPTYAIWPAVESFLAQVRGEADHVGFAEDGSVSWVQLDYRVEFDIWSSGRQVQPYMDLWEDTAKRVFNEVTQKYRGSENCLGMPLPLSDLFQRAEAENRVVNSALSSWIVSVACALVALGAFTRSLWLSGIACFAMLSTAACSLFFITNIFQWRFGLMEAVSLIIFCGFSVDYPLHVVQAYVQERSKGSGVRRALREVGGAVASGCATTCGAAMFLLFCQIRIFTRFGQVLVVNMLFALVFALVWIPAALELCRNVQCRRRKTSAAACPADGEEGYALGLLGGRPTQGAAMNGVVSAGASSRSPERIMMELDGSSQGFSALQG